ncbi:TRAP transporter large permease [Yanghanlia caeni]|uniref:TRAP transporter large permease protein n=1 Tax=Yanghanlia caeni TaxID=3064283 RepID=A0ABU1D921_9BURK|nr:TRAP transporter large permease [Alcaligenaceae bacterium LG-2]
MTQIEIGYFMIAGLLGLLALGVPIALSLILAGGVGLIAIRGEMAASFILESFAFTSAGSLALIVVPLFVFMGQLALSAGMSDKAYRAAKAWFGHLPGGLPIATIFACAGFSTVCGSSVATAAIVSKATIPEMLRAGFSQRLAGGCVAVAGTLGVLIPPSGILIIYSIATHVSIADLFIGALLPGALTAVVYATGTYLMVRGNKELVQRTVLPRMAWGERVKATLQAWEVGFLFVVVIGSIYLGWATATEAAGIGALIALIFALVRKNRPKGSIQKGLLEAGSSTATIFFLIIGSALFSVALSTTQLPTVIAAYVTSFDLHPTVLLLLLLIPYLVMGSFIDGISMIFLTMPVVFPIITEAGINPVVFGIVVTKMVEIGAVTPPVGLNVFVVKGAVPELQLGEVFRGAVPYLLMDLLVVVAIILVPGLVTLPIGG